MQWAGAGRSDWKHIEIDVGIEDTCGIISRTYAKSGYKKAFVVRV
jgi:hypothetical protein